MAASEEADGGVQVMGWYNEQGSGERVKVKMLVQTSFDLRTLRRGDVVEVPQEVAARWLARGIAAKTDEPLTPPPEKPKPKEINTYNQAITSFPK